jgi:hypothetical protein
MQKGNQDESREIAVASKNESGSLAAPRFIF